MLNLGACYYEGDSVEQDKKMAFRLFQHAAESGNVDAILKFGDCFFNGDGTPVDKKIAVELYRQAYNLGNADAMLKLAAFYEDGDVLPPDLNESRILYKQSADLGNTGAIRALMEGHPHQHSKVVNPPYYNEIESFDNPESYPDLEFFIPGMEKPLLLHRIILVRASDYIDAMLRKNKTHKLCWPFDTSKGLDREALVKALRYCYGESLSLETKNGECFAMIAMLLRLQLRGSDETLTSLSNFVIDEALRDVKTGAELLKACTGYTECCGTNHFALDKKLAAIVLTKENMKHHYIEVVDHCLMLLPPEYLMLAEYGEPHTRFSEFYLRIKYVRYHSKELTIQEKQAIVANYDWSSLDSQELHAICLGDAMNRITFLQALDRFSECWGQKNDQMDDVTNQIRMIEEQVNSIKEKSELWFSDAENNVITKRGEKYNIVQRTGNERDLFTIQSLETQSIAQEICL